MGQRSASRVVISGVGAVTFCGEGSEGLEAFVYGRPTPPEVEVEPGLVVPVGRLGRLRRHPFRERFERMSQLDAFSQFAFIATGHALDDAAVPAPHESSRGAGVILGSCYGCQEANLLYDQFEIDPDEGVTGARPAVFKNTVDNVPAGWIALGYKLLGVNATTVSGPGAGAEALLTAVWAIQDDRAAQIVAGGVERLIDPQIVSLSRRAEPPKPFVAEGAATAVLESAGSAAARDHRPRAVVLDATRMPDDDPEAVRSWLQATGLCRSELDVVSLAAPSGAGRDLARVVLERAGLPGPVVIESERTGDTLAAQAPLALTLLLRRLAGGDLRRGLLVATGEPGELFLFLVERGPGCR